MIKQIQLRGISRSPSDRMTSDGGCSESLNVITDSNELAPMPAPEDISEGMALYGVAGEILYIHKSGEMYRNVIVRDGSKVVAYSKDGVAQELYSGADDVRVNDVKSLGNVLLVIIDGQMNYFLYVGGKYEETSGWDELPKISFEPIITKQSEGLHLMWAEYETSGNEPTDQQQYNAVAALCRKYTTFLYDTWENCQAGDYRILRYSLLMYDGKELISEPIVYRNADEILEEFEIDTQGGSLSYESTGLNGKKYRAQQYYSYSSKKVEQSKLKISIEKNAYDKIDTNLIRGIRIYSSQTFSNAELKLQSEERYPYALGGKVYEYTLSGSSITHKIDSLMKLWGKSFFVRENSLSEDITKKDVRLVKTYLSTIEGKTDDTAPMSALLEGDVISFPDNDTLETQPEINFDLEYVPSIGSFSRMIVYNQKLIGVGNSSVPNVRNLPHSAVENTGTSTKKYYSFTFEMVEPTTGKTDVVVARDSSGSKWFSPDSGKMLLGIIYFPSAKCRSVYIEAHAGEPTSARKRKYTMVEHPSMTGYSYALLDNTLSKDLFDILGDTENGTAYTAAPAETQAEKGSQKLFVSELGNPFIFSAAGVFSFDDEILGVATTTKALSSGQFGQFPLYVFTKGGIWSMETATDGSFVTKKPLSRDVALSSDCITPIDQSVVFTTDKGVMLLSGSEVTNLSPFMTGKHYTADSEVTAIAKKIDGFGGLVSSISDKTSFMDFMREARCAYDYSGSRLIFFNGSRPYQYVYKIDTQTWHKMDIGELKNGLSLSEDYYFIKVSLLQNAYTDSMIQKMIRACAGYQMEFILPKDKWDKTHFPADTLVTIGYVNDGQSADYLAESLNSVMSGDGAVEYTCFDEGYSVQYSILNSYPDCWIGVSAKGLQDGETEAYLPISRILNMSTTFDANKVTPLKGIIITRPFDLDEADIRKVLKSVRIRGNHTRGKVVYVLEASMDGIHWGRIPSLRSGSFKLFRIVIFANLDAYERISYIETDYDTVFTNRLR